MAADNAVPQTYRRPRSQRGDGGRLRAEIIEAAREILAETGDLSGLTLRGVARRVGIAATSIYLHFPDTDHLAVAATQQSFADLTAAAAAAAAGISDPAEALLARCRAYCHFALEHPAHYRIMFQLPQTPSLAADPANTPGRRAFQVLVRAVEACQRAGATTATAEPFRLASLVWAAEHGLVSLRLSRPQFPWSDIDELVDEAVTAIMGLKAGRPADGPVHEPAENERAASLPRGTRTFKPQIPSGHNQQRPPARPGSPPPSPARPG